MDGFSAFKHQATFKYQATTARNPPQLDLTMAVTLQDGEIYKLTNLTSTTVLDLSDRDNESVVGYPDVNGKNQEWLFEKSGTKWTLKNVARGNYLAPKNKSDMHSATLIIGQKDKFEWTIEKSNTDYYSLVVPDKKLAVDLSARGSASPGTDVQLWTQSTSKWQAWKIEPVITTGSTIELKNIQYKTIMDLSAANEVDVVGLTENGQDRQHWVIGAAGHDGLTLRNVKTGKYVSCKDATPAIGTLIVASAAPFVWTPVRRHQHVHRLFVPGTNLAISLPSATGQAALKNAPGSNSDEDVNWDFEYLTSGVVTSGYYALVNVDTGLTLDVDSTKKSVVSAKDTTADSQKWYASVSINGCSLQNRSTGTYLAPDYSESTTLQNGKKLALTGAPYDWQLLADGNDNFPAVNQIFIPNENYVATVVDGTNGTSQLWEYLENNNVNWRFEPRS